MLRAKTHRSTCSRCTRPWSAWTKLDPQLVRIVELRFFGGLTVEEAAEVLGSSPATIKRSWSMARAWLKREMERMNES